MKQKAGKLLFGAGMLTALPFVLLTLCAVFLAATGLVGLTRSAGFKTGVTDEGRLRLVYKYVQGERAYCAGYDEDILREEKRYTEGSREILEFTPVIAGSTDMAVWGHEGFWDKFRYDMYHITVDDELNISFTAEEISREEYNRICKNKEQKS